MTFLCILLKKKKRDKDRNDRDIELEIGIEIRKKIPFSKNVYGEKKTQ